MASGLNFTTWMLGWVSFSTLIAGILSPADGYICLLALVFGAIGLTLAISQVISTETEEKE